MVSAEASYIEPESQVLSFKMRSNWKERGGKEGRREGGKEGGREEEGEEGRKE